MIFFCLFTKFPYLHFSSSRDVNLFYKKLRKTQVNKIPKLVSSKKDIKYDEH